MIEGFIRYATAPVYLVICGGMWLYFYVTDMQANTDDMLSHRLRSTNP